MLEVSKRAAEKGYTFFLYGGAEDAPDKMEEFLRERFDGITIVGKYSPPFRALTPEEDDEVCAMINEAKPDFVFVGLGSPKQDMWIYEHLNKIRGSVMVSSGATFDFFSGRIKQAPRWIQRSGFEWLYRLTQDFRRLWRRYTVYNVKFLVAFTLQRLRLRRYRDERFEIPDLGPEAGVTTSRSSRAATNGSAKGANGTSAPTAEPAAEAGDEHPWQTAPQSSASH
jgi:N-acetylglucosaminyldiphosphoundecaprenol N-acetyl-beta-D-mannosaminyltransferase